MYTRHWLTVALAQTRGKAACEIKKSVSALHNSLIRRGLVIPSNIPPSLLPRLDNSAQQT